MDPAEGRTVNILIVKLSAIGDVIHTLPALAALRRLYPEADITWVIEEAAADLLTGHPALNRVIIFRRKSWLRRLRRGKIAEPFREMLAFLRELRRRPYDLVIDFHGLLKSAVIVAASGGRRKLGYDSLQELSGLFYNEKIPEEMGKHAVDRYLDFVRYLAEGQKGPLPALPAPPEFTIAIGQEERRRVAELLGRHAGILPAGKNGGAEAERSAEGRGREQTLSGPGPAWQDGPFVAVSPIAFWETKLWTDGKFAELGDRIRRELGIGVVMTGGEAGPLDRIRVRMKTEAVNLGGLTSLRELACLYRQAALIITTDSGPMHLAAAMGTPVVALFGPTDPARTGPYGPGHRVIRSGLSCVPCLRKRCDTRACMEQIAVEEVFTAVKGMLSERGFSQRLETGLKTRRPMEGVDNGNQ
jgi:heptosyltransferase-1